MGITRQTWDFLQQILPRARPEGRPCRMCELGNQHIKPDVWDRIPPVAGHDRRGQRPFPAKLYFESVGIDHVSLDTNGQDGVLRVDLCVPIRDPSLLASFDVVTNLGTSEHVENQTRCFENIHNLCGTGGWFVHVVPASGHWIGHGTFYYTEAFFQTLSTENGYRIFLVEQRPYMNLADKDCIFAAMIKERNRPFVAAEAFERVARR